MFEKWITLSVTSALLLSPAIAKAQTETMEQIRDALAKCKIADIDPSSALPNCTIVISNISRIPNKNILSYVYFNRGVALVKLNRPREALIDYNLAELDQSSFNESDKVIFYNNRALVHYDLGQRARALSDWKISASLGSTRAAKNVEVVEREMADAVAPRPAPPLTTNGRLPPAAPAPRPLVPAPLPTQVAAATAMAGHVHNPASEATGCVRIESVGTARRAEFVNHCAWPVWVQWPGGLEDIAVGESYPVLQKTGQVIYYACRKSAIGGLYQTRAMAQQGQVVCDAR